MPPNPPSEFKPHSVSFYILLAAGLLIFVKTFSLLSPVLLSLLLILLITLAVNPVISRIREWTGGRKGATAVLTLALVEIVGIVHDELYRKRFLPNVSDSDLDRLSRKAMLENITEVK